MLTLPCIPALHFTLILLLWILLLMDNKYFTLCCDLGFNVQVTQIQRYISSVYMN